MDSLMTKRIDTVHQMLQERDMSEWARNYWTNVLNSLIIKYKGSMN